MRATNRSLSLRLSLNILIVSSLLFLLSAAVIDYYSYKIVTEEVTHTAQNALDAHVAHIESTLGRVEHLTKGNVWKIQENIHDTDYLYHITRTILEHNSDIVGMAIAFVPDYFEGKHYFSPYSTRVPGSDSIVTMQLGHDKYDYFHMEWYDMPMHTQKACWSEPYYDEGGGNQLMATYSEPIYDKHGKLCAVVTADISLQWISQIISSLKFYEHSYATLVSGKGYYVESSSAEQMQSDNIYELAKKYKNKGFSKYVEQMMTMPKGHCSYYYNHKKVFSVYGQLDNGWHLSVMCQYRDVLRQSTRIHIIVLLVLMAGLTALYFVCRRVIRHITQPITELSVSAMNMAMGNFHAKLVEVNTHDEMRQLRDSFAYMQKSINDYIAELRTATMLNERMVGELTVAKKIQEGMLPKDFPSGQVINEQGTLIRSYSLHALLRSAKEVGGDMYDFVIKENKLYAVIGDVSGKGVAAAIYMAIVKASFRFFVNRGLDIKQVVSYINTCLSDGNTSNMFCTMFAACIHLDSGLMEYCNAGHNPIVVLPAPVSGNMPYYLKAKANLALGVMGDFTYEAESLMLEKGSRLFLYTDGVTEAEKNNKEQYGDARLLRWAEGIACEGAEIMNDKAAIDSLLESIDTYTQGNEQNDDITIMMISL